MQTVVLTQGWIVRFLVDDDIHLNIWIENRHSLPIRRREIDIGRDGEDGVEGLVYKFTTQKIEKESEK